MPTHPTDLRYQQLSGIHELETREEYLASVVERLQVPTKSFRTLYTGPLFLHPDWYFQVRGAYSKLPAMDPLVWELLKNSRQLDSQDVRISIGGLDRYQTKVREIITEDQLPRLKAEVLERIHDLWGPGGEQGPLLCVMGQPTHEMTVLFDDCVYLAFRPAITTQIDSALRITNPELVLYHTYLFDHLFEKASNGQHHEVQELIDAVDASLSPHPPSDDDESIVLR